MTSETTLQTKPASKFADLDIDTLRRLEKILAVACPGPNDSGPLDPSSRDIHQFNYDRGRRSVHADVTHAIASKAQHDAQQARRATTKGNR